MPKLFTKNGRDFYEVSSLLQKALRRGDMKLAAVAASELLPKYSNYVWNRLMTVSAEDCADFVTGEVVALHDAWLKLNQGKPDKDRGRIFFSKAIVILARAKKSRDADELLLLVADRFPATEFDRELAECERTVSEVDAEWDGQIPQYVYDVHTRRGKAAGKTRQQFLREEHDALVNSETLFENVDEMIDSPTYIEPRFRR